MLMLMLMLLLNANKKPEMRTLLSMPCFVLLIVANSWLSLPLTLRVFTSSVPRIPETSALVLLIRWTTPPLLALAYNEGTSSCASKYHQHMTSPTTGVTTYNASILALLDNANISQTEFSKALIHKI